MPIRSCVTVSLVPASRGGPFVYWDDLPAACQAAANLGFDAIEIFSTGPGGLDPVQLRGLLTQHQLQLAALGTGAGWVLHKLSLSHPDSAQRFQARAFVKSIIDLAGPFGASAIIGSMQGRWGDGVSRQQGLGYLLEALDELGQHAAQYNVPLIYEPLNRYETNMVNTVAAGVELLERLPHGNVQLLADLFHMNIEEADIPAAFRTGGRQIGHVHFVDSNRRPAGCGHLDLAAVGKALHEIGYAGYASAEALPYPDPEQAARQTMESFRKFLA